MISAARRKLRLFSRRLWVRATLLSLIGVAAAFAAVPIAQLLPQSWLGRIGADAADSILNIIASSMLAVTTFSLSTVVSAYSAATSNVTPRATQILIEDSTAQNTLAVFVGTFIYSFATLILLSTGAYGEEGRAALFVVTLVVVAIMVGTLLRWIDYLLRFGRVGETTQRVEDITREALEQRRREPHLGGVPLEPDASLDGLQAIHAPAIGYVQHVDMGSLDAIAERIGQTITVTGLPGVYVHTARAVAHVAGAVSEEDAAAIGAAFSIGQARSFDQDPRFGLIVLAEIASRALSPGINDPGTAIDVIGRGVRLLADWAVQPEEMPEVLYPHVAVAGLSLDDLVDDLFGPIARNGATMFEVQARLQKALGYLHDMGDARMKAVAKEQSRRTFARAELGALSPDDRAAVEQSGQWAKAP